MATPEQLQAALINADKAGDVQAATALATELKRIQQPAAVEAGSMLKDIPRQLGLTARYAMEAPAEFAQVATEPLRYLTDRLTGSTGKTVPLGVLASQFADKIGLPQPADANERAVAEGTKLGFGSLAGAGVAQKLGGVASDALQFAGKNLPAVAQGAGQKLAQFLGMNPGQQVVSAAGAGLAGGAAKEAGASPLEQGVASLVGGVGSGLGAQAATAFGNKVATTAKNLMPGQQQLIQQRIDQRINISLQTQGIDPATITPAMRSAMREQVGRAMNTGSDLNPEAIGRLADYTRLQMTPTRARLTLDPFDVTQEANASKLAAATGSRDARLPQIANDNNRRLIGLIDDMGGARPADSYGAGAAVTGAIRARDEGLQQGVTSLYQQARDTGGRSLPLNGSAFTTQANQALDENLLGHALPESVAGHMNRIARGEVPFTVDYAEQLKTVIGKLQRESADGSTRRALGIVRSALDDTPLVPAGQVNPGNLPAVPGTVPPSPMTAGQESIDAFNRARSAARERFSWQESSPVIGRALDGANADTFIQQNILSKAAGFDHVAQAAQTINANPAAREAVRTSIVQHLKAASIGKGGTSETGNFSGRGLTAALDDIGNRKLGLFFDQNEIETLRAMARTGSFEVFQPRGSAVNNSNTAAGVGSLLMNVADRVRPIANKFPLGEMVVSRPLDYIAAGVMQRPALNVPQGLLAPAQRAPVGAGLLLPGLAAGGLLAAPTQ